MTIDNNVNKTNEITMNQIIDDLHEYADSEAEMYGYSSKHYKFSYDPYLLTENSWNNTKSDDYPTIVSISDYYNDEPSYSKEEWFKNHVIETFKLYSFTSGYNDILINARNRANDALNAADSMFALRVLQGVEMWGMHADEAVLVDMRALLTDDVLHVMADYNKTILDITNAINDSYSVLINDDNVQKGADVIRKIVNIDADWIREHVKNVNPDVYNDTDDGIAKLDYFMRDKIIGHGIPWNYINPSYYHLLTYYLAGLNDLAFSFELIDDGLNAKDVIHNLHDYVTNERIECIIGVGADDYIDKHGIIGFFNLLGDYAFSIQGVNALINIAMCHFSELPEPDAAGFTEGGNLVYKYVMSAFGRKVTNQFED